MKNKGVNANQLSFGGKNKKKKPTLFSSCEGLKEQKYLSWKRKLQKGLGCRDKETTVVSE